MLAQSLRISLRNIVFQHVPSAFFTLVFTVSFLFAPAIVSAKHDFPAEHVRFLQSQKLVSQKKASFTVRQTEALASVLKTLSNHLLFIPADSSAPFVQGGSNDPYLITARWDGLLREFRHFDVSPLRRLTRREGAYLIMKTLVNSDISYDPYRKIKSPYRDTDEIHDIAAYKQNIFRAKGKNFFPNRPMKRKEFLEALYRALVQKQKQLHLTKGPFLLAQAEDMVSVPVAPVFPEPYKEGEVAKPLISADAEALPDLIIDSIQPYKDHDSFGTAIAVTVKNIGNKETTVNFGIFDRPDWYNYKPGWNSGVFTASFADPSSPESFLLLPGRTFVFYLYEKCDNPYKTTQSLLIAVDPNFARGAGNDPDMSIDDMVQESDEKNNSAIYTCG